MKISPVSSWKKRESSCPETYRELRRRNDDDIARFTLNDDDDDDSDDDDDDMSDDQWRESVCEQTMRYISQRGNRGKIDPVLLNFYCPHYQESSALARENNDTLCEQKTKELRAKRKRNDFDTNELFDDDSSDNDDGHDDNKRRSLRKKELKKRFAVRFIRKRAAFRGPAKY